MKHTRFRRSTLLAAMTMLIVCAPFCRADLNIGVLSYDVLIPSADPYPGVNIFDIYNFTGDPALSGFALPPDFPVLTFASLTNVSLLFNGTGSPVTLPDIAPGSLDQGSAPQFSSDTQFTSVLFTATLNNTILQLDDGTTFLADPIVTAMLLPSSGPDLVAGTDLVVLEATGTFLNSTLPEPTYTALIALIAVSILVGRDAKTLIQHIKG